METQTFLAIVLALLLGGAFYREVFWLSRQRVWDEERKDLYSRLQSGTLRDYTQQALMPEMVARSASQTPSLDGDYETMQTPEPVGLGEWDEELSMADRGMRTGYGRHAE